ncbi:hypothetical protein RvY_03513 [Ramazzottius varieornatus]|uniref:Uncharacterized protein n=1 Tax=Ramazzottius varieornatus TaxID=947166 RepID=A0A1D1UP47_RAMVA|nr:hypothetical protein RvY_03513 [Ramazzottius varieornatus]
MEMVYGKGLLVAICLLRQVPFSTTSPRRDSGKSSASTLSMLINDFQAICAGNCCGRRLPMEKKAEYWLERVVLVVMSLLSSPWRVVLNRRQKPPMDFPLVVGALGMESVKQGLAGVREDDA